MLWVIDKVGPEHRMTSHLIQFSSQKQMRPRLTILHPAELMCRRLDLPCCTCRRAVHSSSAYMQLIRDRIVGTHPSLSPDIDASDPSHAVQLPAAIDGYANADCADEGSRQGVPKTPVEGYCQTVSHSKQNESFVGVFWRPSYRVDLQSHETQN